MTHVEAGLIGCGPLAERGHYDYTLVDASTRPTTKTYDAVCFESPMSFGIIRGGHLDVTVLGALQVDQYGKLDYTWKIIAGSRWSNGFVCRSKKSNCCDGTYN